MSNQQERVSRILGDVGAVITNTHVVYTSGMHGSEYVNKDAIYPFTRRIANLCGMIAEHFVESKIEAVIGPALGGIILSQRVADRLTAIYGDEVLAVYAEKDKDDFVIKRGYDRLLDGKVTLVVEDVLTTGDSARKVVVAARKAGAKIVGVGALCNRGGVTVQDLGVGELHALLNVSMKAYVRAECPMCQAGVPINKDVGKGREYLASLQGS